MIEEVPFGEFLPDQPTYKNPGCVMADNCFPSAGGYAPFHGGTPQAPTNTEAVRGAALMFNTAGDRVIVGGSDTRLFIINGTTLTATTGYTSIGANNYWRFARFNDRIYATAENNYLQTLDDIDTSTAWAPQSVAPPQAKEIGRIGNFLVLGNLTSPMLPYTFQWSAENDPTDWPTPGTNDARLKQSGRAALQPEYGEITGITGDRYPLIFQKRAISRISPAGPPTVFQVQTIEEARGATAPGSIVTVGFVTYFLSHDGFFATDGNQVIPLGSRRVNEWFFDTVDETNRFRTHGAVAWEQQSIVWTFYSQAGTGYNRQLIYSWAENRFSTASLSVDYMVDNSQSATTLEDLNALFPAGLESVTPSLDSDVWKAKSRVLSAFIDDNGSSVLNRLNAVPLAASFETGEFQPAPGRRVEINAIYPVIENASLNTTAQARVREFKGGPVTASSLNPINAAGFCPARLDGRFASAKVVIPAGADWDNAQGIQVDFRPSGMR